MNDELKAAHERAAFLCWRRPTRKVLLARIAQLEKENAELRAARAADSAAYGRSWEKHE